MLSKYLYLQLRLNHIIWRNILNHNDSAFRLSIYNLSKPASLLCFVDPSLCTSYYDEGRFADIFGEVPDGRSTG